MEAIMISFGVVKIFTVVVASSDGIAREFVIWSIGFSDGSDRSVRVGCGR
jgi:hypothetical protein